MMPRQHISPDRRRLAAALRELREAVGLSAARFGEPYDWSQSKVSKIEHGTTVPSPDDVNTWALAAGATRERAAELAALAEQVGTESRTWAAGRYGSLAARNEEAGANEARADAISVFQNSVIPGLLQTAGYARAVLEMLGTDEPDIAAAVNTRMQRQDVLYQTGKRFEFVLTEAALRWRPGSRAMLAGQLDRVLAVATLANTGIHVLPLDVRAPALYLTSFTVYEIPDAPLVLTETLRREVYFYQDADVEAFAAAFVRLRGGALAGDGAVAFIRDLRDAMLRD